MSTELVAFNDLQNDNVVKISDTIMVVEILTVEISNQVKPLFEFIMGSIMNSPLESNQLNKLSIRLMVKYIIQNRKLSSVNTCSTVNDKSISYSLLTKYISKNVPTSSMNKMTIWTGYKSQDKSLTYEITNKLLKMFHY